MGFKILKAANNNTMQSFLNVPSLVYGTNIVPPSAGIQSMGMRFSPVFNTVLQHVRFANFVAYDDEKRPVGRITATIDELNPREEEGFFGCFECIDNGKVAEELLDAAAGWLREKNKSVMIGPATLNTNEQVGLLIDGFEHEPQVEIPYNLHYYKNLIENAGLEKVQELECFSWKLPDIMPEKLEKSSLPEGVVIRSINFNNLIKEAKIVQEVNNKAMARIWGFIPMTANDAQGFLSGLASRVPRELFIIIEADKKPAGMFLSIPFKKPAREKKGKVRLAIGGVVPEFQHRGIHWAVLKEFYLRCKKLGYAEGEASQVAESNDVIKRKIIKPLFGGEVIKRYRVYKKILK